LLARSEVFPPLTVESEEKDEDKSSKSSKEEVSTTVESEETDEPGLLDPPAKGKDN